MERYFTARPRLKETNKSKLYQYLLDNRKSELKMNFATCFEHKKAGMCNFHTKMLRVFRILPLRCKLGKAFESIVKKTQFPQKKRASIETFT